MPGQNRKFEHMLANNEKMEQQCNLFYCYRAWSNMRKIRSYSYLLLVVV